jgi:AraC-like DNA-binding protein
MSTSASTSPDLGLPAIYLHTLAELLRSIGVDEQSLMLRVGLDPSRMKSTDLRVSLSQASEFVTRAIIESGEPGLGVMLAREMKLPLHGALGVAVMSSRTLQDALELMTRYLLLRAPHLEISHRHEGDNEIFTIFSRVDLGPLHGFIMDAMLYGCAVMGSQLTGGAVPGGEIRRRGPEPNYFRRFSAELPSRVLYDCPEDAFVIPSQDLELPIRFTDDQLAEVSRAQCEEALHHITEDAGFACRVRRVIETSYPFPPKLARVAGTLFVSERTLKRRLQEEEASFQNLVDQVRLDRAGELLANTSMTLSQIADALGYADAANFTRAFKRWTGSSPSQFRARSREPRPAPKTEDLTVTA